MKFLDKVIVLFGNLLIIMFCILMMLILCGMMVCVSTLIGDHITSEESIISENITDSIPMVDIFVNCTRIECECAKNTTTPCMAYCVECRN